MNRTMNRFRRVALTWAACIATTAFFAERTTAKPPPEGDGPLAGPRHRPAPPPADVGDEMDRPGEDGVPPGEPGGPRGPKGRFRDRGDRWPRRMEGDGPLNEKMVERVMGELKDRLPQWHDRLAALKTSDPRKFDMAMRRILPMVREAKMLGEHNPQLAESMFKEFEIEHELRGLSEKFKTASSTNDQPQMAQVVSEIDGLVRQQFEIRRMRRQAQLEEFARRLAEQQKRIEKEIAEHAEQGARAEEFIARRVEEIKKGEFRGPSLFGGSGRPGRPGGPDGDFGPRGPRKRGIKPRPGDGPMSGRFSGPGEPHPDGPPPPSHGEGFDGPPHDRPPHDGPRHSPHPMDDGDEMEPPPPPPGD